MSITFALIFFHLIFYLKDKSNNFESFHLNQILYQSQL